jgi:hypothetical protein
MVCLLEGWEVEVSRNKQSQTGAHIRQLMQDKQITRARASAVSRKTNDIFRAQHDISRVKQVSDSLFHIEIESKSHCVGPIKLET